MIRLNELIRHQNTYAITSLYSMQKNPGLISTSSLHTSSQTDDDDDDDDDLRTPVPWADEDLHLIISLK
jgi:hypothetical protein